jgi:hypothetical protein
MSKYLYCDVYFSKTVSDMHLKFTTGSRRNRWITKQNYDFATTIEVYRDINQENLENLNQIVIDTLDLLYDFYFKLQKENSALLSNIEKNNHKIIIKLIKFPFKDNHLRDLVKIMKAHNIPLFFIPRI